MNEKAKNGFREEKNVVIKILEYKQMSGNVHWLHNAQASQKLWDFFPL